MDTGAHLLDSHQSMLSITKQDETVEFAAYSNVHIDIKGAEYQDQGEPEDFIASLARADTESKELKLKL